MANKKKKSTKAKSSKKKSSKDLESDHGSFWALSGAILLIVVAAFLLIGGFGTGGPLPVGLFKGAYFMLGYAAYITPIALVYWGVYKFMAEDKRIPLPNLMGMLSVLLFSSTWFFVAFASQSASGSWDKGHGGAVGEILGKAVLTALDQMPASLLFLILTILAIFFSFGVSPKVLLKIGELFKKPEDDDNDLAALKAKAGEGFKLNEGVPVERHNGEEEPQGKFAGLKNSAAKLSAAEDHSALTTASDPNWQFPSVKLLDQKQDKADA
ncbi:MAG: hypothetical protein EBX41_11325, partial [Chitinophagia bacterium]|nr:hypothetical protein [Chitinophagia bacterium]